jgi:hypothetical protein
MLTIEEARAFEQTRDLVNQALKSRWNPAPSNDGPYGPYVVQTFDDRVVFEWAGKTMSADYTIDVADGKSEVTLSEPTEVFVTYEPVTESADAPFAGDFVPLKEKSVNKKGEAQIKIIQPGWGSSGYYGADMLERDGPALFKTGTKMYWDHPTATEEAERPERSLRDLAAELTTDARYLSNGPEGAGLYADAKVFEGFVPAVEQMAPHIGVSIRGIGKAKQGVAEGRKGPIIEKLVAAKSVDFVTEPGAGGQVVQLFESARRKAGTPTGDDDMDEAKVAEMIEAATKPLQESLTTTATTLKETQTENARLREALLLREARDFVVAEVNKSALPGITRARLAESLGNECPVKEGALDREALAETVKTAIEAETQYLSKVTGSPIRGMNSDSGEHNVEEAGKKLESAFAGMGLTESAAKVAAAGRN